MTNSDKLISTLYKKRGHVSISVIRDEEIYNEYFSAIESDPRVDKGKLRKELSLKYCIGIKSIEAALYGKKKNVTG